VSSGIGEAMSGTSSLPAVAIPDAAYRTVRCEGLKLKLHIKHEGCGFCFETLRDWHGPNAQGFLVPYDVTNRESFEHALYDVSKQAYCIGDKSCMLLGCCPMPEEGVEQIREVDRHEAEAEAARHSMLFAEVNPFVGANLDGAAAHLVKQCLIKIRDKEARETAKHATSNAKAVKSKRWWKWW